MIGLNLADTFEAFDIILIMRTWRTVEMMVKMILMNPSTNKPVTWLVLTFVRELDQTVQTSPEKKMVSVSEQSIITFLETSRLVKSWYQ